MPQKKDHILVIRLGALGDLIFCFQAFHEIRLAHPGAKIALLTRPAFAAFARSLPWFDDILIDTYPTLKTPLKWLRLRKEIAAFGPKCVYDLQGKKRQTILYALMGGPFGPAWSGAAPFCAFPRPWPPETTMSFKDFLAAQLRIAGVPSAPPPDLAWLDAATDKFNLPARYAVLIPGCSPGAPHKRWPPENFAALAQKLRQEKALPCVVVGTTADAAAVAEIKRLSPDIMDVCGQTTLFELAGLFRRAEKVIGNDTGPLHMAAVVGTPTLALFSGRSNPLWSKPPGPNVTVIQKETLAELTVADLLPHL